MGQPAEAKNRVGGSSVCSIGGQVAQLVEQRTENPCVGGSIPSLATIPSSVCHCKRSLVSAYIVKPILLPCYLAKSVYLKIRKSLCRRFAG